MNTLKYQCQYEHQHATYQVLLKAIAPKQVKERVGGGDARAYESLLGLDRGSLVEPIKWRSLFDMQPLDANVEWFQARKQRADTFVVAHRDLYLKHLEWWECSGVAQQSPELKHVRFRHRDQKKWHKGACTKCDSSCPIDCDKHCQQHAGHALKMPLDDAYDQFKLDLPEVAEHLHSTAFCLLRPYWAVPAKDNTCLCVYHYRMRLYLEAYRRISKECHEDCDCACQFCVDGECETHIHESTETVRAHVLCPKPAGSDYYRLECVTNQCEQCKDFKRAKVLSCKCENDPELAVHWKDYAQETHKYTVEEDGAKEVREKTRTVLKKMEGTAAEFMVLFREVATSFFEHSHVARRSAVQFDEMLKNLPEGHLAILEDFQMNYTHSHNNAIQGPSRSVAMLCH